MTERHMVERDTDLTAKEIDFVHATDVYRRISTNIRKVIKGDPQTIKLLLAAFFAGGHVLLEDVPWTGKTTLAKTLARSISPRWKNWSNCI